MAARLQIQRLINGAEVLDTAHQFAKWPPLSCGNFFSLGEKPAAESVGDTFRQEKRLFPKQQGAQSTGVNEAVLSGP